VVVGERAAHVPADAVASGSAALAEGDEPMRRRQRADPHAPPRHLVRYDPADWSGAECPSCAFYAAASKWHAAHPDAPVSASEDMATWPDDPWECASKSL
jgi:hypothetical protein